MSRPPARTPTANRRRLIGLVAVAVIVVVAGLAASGVLGGPRRQLATGIVVAVEATSLSDVTGFSIRTRDGQTVDFRISGPTENGSTFAPGHLAEHKVTLAPIQVTYVDRAGGHVALRIEDAP